MVDLVDRKTSCRLISSKSTRLSRIARFGRCILHLHSCIRFDFLAGQKLVDIVIDDNLVKPYLLPAEGTVGFMLQADHTLPADGMMHGADNDRLLAAAVVVVEADLALRDVL